jgi:FeS assembly SUF system protein
MSEADRPSHHQPLKVLPEPEKLERILDQAEQRQAAKAGSGDAAASAPPAPPAAALHDPAQARSKKLLEGKIIEVLRTIYDPEIPVNIYDLGLIYGIDVADDNGVEIRMTLTAPGCPVAGDIVAEVHAKVQAIEEVKGAEVNLVWDPPWSRDLMSEAAQLDLGLL